MKHNFAALKEADQRRVDNAVNKGLDYWKEQEVFHRLAGDHYKASKAYLWVKYIENAESKIQPDQ